MPIETPIYYFSKGMDRVIALIMGIQDLNRKIQKLDTKEISPKHPRAIKKAWKKRIEYMVEMIFPAFVSALEQYYKSKLIQKLDNKEFREVYIINKTKFSKVLKEFDIKNKVLDEMLDRGFRPGIINLGNYIEDNRKLNFQDFQNQVSKIYKIVFEVNIKDKQFFIEPEWNNKIKGIKMENYRDYLWSEIIKIRKCRNMVIHGDGKIKRKDIQDLNLDGKEEYIDTSVAELYIDWSEKDEKPLLGRINEIVILTQHYIRKLDKYIDALEYIDKQD